MAIAIWIIGMVIADALQSPEKRKEKLSDAEGWAFMLSFLWAFAYDVVQMTK